MEWWDGTDCFFIWSTFREIHSLPNYYSFLFSTVQVLGIRDKSGIFFLWRLPGDFFDSFFGILLDLDKHFQNGRKVHLLFFA